jgi:hypothetical protein
LDVAYAPSSMVGGHKVGRQADYNPTSSDSGRGKRNGRSHLL